MRRLPALLASAMVVAAAALGGGCGEGEVAGGATVSVYVAAPICKEAQQALRTADEEAGDLDVRAICLPPVDLRGEVELGTAGANGRRATEDSTAVAYLEAPGPAARFTRSIVEAADIAWIETTSGAAAIREILKTLEERGSSPPRDAVRDSPQP